jgi:DNA invertase Pin-like site-specific DNA recombinase
LTTQIGGSEAAEWRRVSEKRCNSFCRGGQSWRTALSSLEPTAATRSTMKTKLNETHLERRAYVYVRQSTAMQVHEHVESKQRQYALVDRAAALGWGRSNIEVVDEDQGKSGATSEGRTGFARLAEAVGHGEAGAILAIEVSRLARSSMDWQRLLSLCSVAGVAVIDEQGIYDAADRDDRLLLDLKGTMSEAELQWLRLRLVGGRLNKARRGALWLHAPIGYVWRDTRFERDPDEAVQRAVTTVFERFAIEPTSWAVVRWSRETGFRFPSRKHDGELEWRDLTMGRLNSLLHNPTYAGVYTYGRKPTVKAIVDGTIRERRKRLPIDEWPVKIDAAHPAYISWETFVSNQERLHQNLSKMHGATSGAPKNGPALLTGIVLCGRCGRRMRVDYTTHERKLWRYVCVGKHVSMQRICWSVTGNNLDDTVEKLFLDTMTPSEIDLSIAVEREANGQAQSLAGQWEARLEQARYEARRAERRYKSVDPDNRVVARTLERDWEARLQDLADVERQYADARRERRVELSAVDREALRAIARDLPMVWRSETTPAADRKAMLRLVIEAITLEPIDLPRPMTRVRVQWRSGVVDERFVDRPRYNATSTTLIEKIRELAAACLDDDQIAARFNADGVLTQRQRTWTAPAVAKHRHKYGIAVAPKPRNKTLPDRHPTTGRLSIPGAARRFGVPKYTIRNWIRSGMVISHRERYGRYDASWLDIDDELAARLERLVLPLHE